MSSGLHVNETKPDIKLRTSYLCVQCNDLSKVRQSISSNLTLPYLTSRTWGRDDAYSFDIGSVF